MTSSADLQQQITQAEAKVSELHKQLAEQNKEQRGQAILAAKELIAKNQLTALELGFSGKKSLSAKISAAEGKRTKVAPKYANPSDGKTWTGRGKTPAWMVACLAAGQAKDDFLIQKS